MNGYDTWYTMSSIWRDKKGIFTPKTVLKSVPKPKSRSNTARKADKRGSLAAAKTTMISPPPYTGLPPAASCSVSASPTVPSIYPSLTEMIKTKADSPDGAEGAASASNVAAVWVAKPRGIEIIPPSPSVLKDLISLLPEVDKPLQFVDMLLRSSRHCQLIGADYRFIL